MRVCDEFDGGFGWIRDGRMQRCSHALVAGGRVWLVDPVDEEGLDERVRAAGDPAGVIQLLDRHARDCAAIAARLDVPRGGPTPFELIPLLRRRRWWESALWWPETRTLVCADALGTAAYFLAPAERLGVHPLLRLTPPRALAGLEPERVLSGHGRGVHDGAAEALREALRTSRRRIPSLVLGLVRR